MAVCNGLNSHALRPGSIYTGGTSDTLMELKVTQRHLGHCNMPLLVPRQRRAKLPELLHGHLVPTTHGLRHNRDEGDTLLVAEIGCHPHLVVVGVDESVARLGSCPCPGCILERVDYSHIQCSVSAPCPVGEKNVGWPPVISRQQSASLLL